jgi:hypothetical protein
MINRKYRNIRIYRILKHYGGEANIVSRKIQSLVDKYLLKSNKMEYKG